MRNKVKRWEPENFELETNTIWSFEDRGNWATHDEKYRGNWSPYIPRNLLLKYTKEKDLVLDQFAGGGTTLVEAKLLNRDIIGIDVNEKALERCKKKCNFKSENMGKVYFYKKDARNLDFIPNEKIDFICTHPPYANIIKYSENLENDLSHFEIKDFLIEMEKVANECYRILKKDKFCSILMGDVRKNGKVFPLGFETMKIFENIGFELKEVIIKEQHNCKSTKFWKEKSKKYNFLLLAHEYLFVFKK